MTGIPDDECLILDVSMNLNNTVFGPNPGVLKLQVDVGSITLTKTTAPKLR